MSLPSHAPDDVRPSTIGADVIEDSISPDGARLTTVVVTLPRSALAELNTHRAFSRNSASSRAVPVARMIEYVSRTPYVPRAFSLNKPGMNASEFIEPASPRWGEVLTWWLDAARSAVDQARIGLDLGLHKQDVNRILEPFLMHTVVVSSTSWSNFFEQRLALDEAGHPLAYLPIYDAALAIESGLAASEPQLLEPGQWHTPFVTQQEQDELSAEDRRSVAAARCARVSYFTATGDRIVGGGRDVDADLVLCNRLRDPGANAAPHMSPFEHVATPDPVGSGNFQGWTQWRAEIEGAWRLNA